MPSRLFCLKVQRSKCNLQCLNFQCKPLIEFHKNNERNINKAHKNGALMKLPLLMMLLETACLQSTFIILPDNYFCNSWQGIQREHLLFMQSLPRYLFFLTFLPLTTLSQSILHSLKTSTVFLHLLYLLHYVTCTFTLSYLRSDKDKKGYEGSSFLII